MSDGKAPSRRLNGECLLLFVKESNQGGVRYGELCRFVVSTGGSGSNSHTISATYVRVLRSSNNAKDSGASRHVFHVSRGPISYLQCCHFGVRWCNIAA